MFPKKIITTTAIIQPNNSHALAVTLYLSIPIIMKKSATKLSVKKLSTPPFLSLNALPLSMKNIAKVAKTINNAKTIFLERLDVTRLISHLPKETRSFLFCLTASAIKHTSLIFLYLPCEYLFTL